MLRVFVGYDPDQPIAFHALAQSLVERCSVPVAITPLVLRQLPLDRPRELDQTSEFSFSRFLVPWLCRYEGRALYLDCDFLARCDVSEIFAAADPDADVSVVKHEYRPRGLTKFLQKPQTAYERKNWSSLMLYTCGTAACRELTPGLLNYADAAWLRQLRWAERIGELPATYNHLVGEAGPRQDARMVHFTEGTPCFGGYARCEHSEEWRGAVRAANYHRSK